MWNHVVIKKVLNKSKYILYLRFFKVATLCLDDSFARSWHSLNLWSEREDKHNVFADYDASYWISMD